MLINIIFMVISVAISSFGIIYVIINHENYGASITKFFVILILFGLGICVNIALNLSYEVLFSEGTAIRLWRSFLIVSTLMLVLLSSMHSLIVEDSNLKFIPALFGGFFGGLIVARLHLLNSLSINLIGETYSFAILDTYLLSLMIFFCLTMLAITWMLQIRNYVTIRNKELGNKITLMVAAYSIAIIVHISYLITHVDLLKDLQLFLYLLTALYVVYTVVKKPYLFVSLTNEVYNFIIFHRSGILLYSYNFETGKETDDSILKGSILIGINHILANFMNKKDQVSVIKMKNRDIILEFDRDYGYALLVIVKKSDTVIRKAIYKFMTKFKQENKETLEKMSGLIDTSGFKNTTEIIYEFFHPFMINKK